MNAPREMVSVIIPVHNSERYIAETLESVVAQAHQPLEIIVVDDGSSDRTREIVESFACEIRLEVQPRCGSGRARNVGAELARGDFLAFLDADDLWEPDKLKKQLEVFRNDAEADLVFSHVTEFFSPELGRQTIERLRNAGMRMPGMVPGALLIRRRAWERIGPFSEGWNVGNWIDWYARSQEMGLKSVMLDDVLMLRRIHTGNLTLKDADRSKEYVQALKAALDRRRAASPR